MRQGMARWRAEAGQGGMRGIENEILYWTRDRFVVRKSVGVVGRKQLLAKNSNGARARLKSVIKTECQLYLQLPLQNSTNQPSLTKRFQLKLIPYHSKSNNRILYFCMHVHLLKIIYQDSFSMERPFILFIAKFRLKLLYCYDLCK